MVHIFVDFYHGFVIGSEIVTRSFCSWLHGMGALRDYSSCKQHHEIEVSWKPIEQLVLFEQSTNKSKTRVFSEENFATFA